MIVPPEAENRTIVSSFVWTKCDGQTICLLQRCALRALRTRCKYIHCADVRQLMLFNAVNVI